MAEDAVWPDRQLLAACRLADICPVCERPIEGGGYGTGRIADGLFCSLDHVAEYWYSPRPKNEREGA